MEGPKKKVKALDMTEDNPFYVKYMKGKEKFLKKKPRKLSEEEFAKIDYDHSDYYFLCFMTKKYFKDNILVSFEKILLGVGAVIFLILINKLVKKGKWLKAIVMYVFLTYSIISIPLAFLYLLANLFCLLRYKEYITTRESVLAKKINIFYDEDTDKLQAVNWRTVFKRDDSVFKENRRLRGW